MAILDFAKLMSKRQDASVIFDLDLIDEGLQDNYLKEIALNIVIDFVARSVAQSEFRVYQKSEVTQDESSYRLNVRPNPNQSAYTFWRNLVRKMLHNGKALVVQSDTRDLLIADSFTVNDVELYSKTFSNVSVGQYTFTRTFGMDDVWYIEYDNKHLSSYIKKMSEEINGLYSRIIETAKRNNQLRATVNVDATLAGDDEDGVRKKLQEFINKAYEAIQHNSVVVLPQTKGFDYKEQSSSEGVGAESVSQLKVLLDQLVDTTANLVGIPPSLIHGQNEKLDSNIKSYLDFCLRPLLKGLQDELNAKLYTREEYLSGKHVRVIGLNKRDIFDVAASIDKVISSSVLSPNEVRNELGLEPRDGGDEYALTKNYELKGGEKDESEN